MAEILREIKEEINILPDNRSRELIEEAIDWALENPEAIYAHSAGKIQRYSHYPNIVVFPEMLRAIDNWSTAWGESVKTIKHDEQDQFKSALRFWHEILSNASPTPITLIGEPELVVRRVYGSDFHITRDSNSPGLQVIDLILWLANKAEQGFEFPKEYWRLGEYLNENTTWYELSLQSIIYGLEEFFHHLNSTPISEERLAKAKELLKFEEARRQKRMQEYAKSKFGSNLKGST